MSMLVLFFCSSAPQQASEPTPIVEAPTLLVEAEAVPPALQMDEELATALRNEDHALAALRLQDLPASPERDLLLAWALVHADRPEEAATFSALDGPADMVDLIQGRSLLARNRTKEAEQTLGRIPAESPLYREALTYRAEALTRLGDERAREILEELANSAEADEAQGEALLRLTSLDPGGPWAMKLWTTHPHRKGPEVEVSWREASQRAEALMSYGDWNGAIASLDGFTPEGEGIDACRFRYVKGRSLYKKNDKVAAEAAMKGPCTDPEYGPKLAYLQARNAYRRGHHKTAAARYTAMTAAWPEHSYADDGLVLGGRARMKAGDRAGAQALWRRALEEYPEGDMSAEGAFELGWTLYLDGKGEEAEEAMLALGELAVAVDPVHVTGGRYWAGRLALYPKVASPNTPHEAGRDAVRCLALDRVNRAGQQAGDPECVHNIAVPLSVSVILPAAPVKRFARRAVGDVGRHRRAPSGGGGRVHVSHVEGDLRPEVDAFEAFRATFPAGTVSGAPKIRAMEIIAELESDLRGPYAGALGYFGFGGMMETAITIRTIIMKDGVASVQAGGGIVYDSKPEAEFEETVNKAMALFTALDLAEERSGAQRAGSLGY